MVNVNISNLIAAMAQNGATDRELSRAIRYSAKHIDAERAYRRYEIGELIDKYMAKRQDESETNEGNMTYEQEYEAMDTFFDKYSMLIEKAPRNSLLGMIRDIDRAMVGIGGHIVDDDNLTRHVDDPRLREAKARITHVAILLAQMWTDENQDIELHDVTKGE